jgi:hypothetical protein
MDIESIGQGRIFALHTTFMVTLQPLKVVEKATILPRCTGLSVEGSLAEA